LVGLLALLGVSPGAAAGPLDDALARLAADSFSDTEKAIEEIAASGAPDAAEILDAMKDRRLLVASDKSVVFQKPGGGFTVLPGGAALPAAPSGTSPVRLNNRLRGVIDAAIASLTLKAPARERRLAAAEAIFKSRDRSMLAALDNAIASERDPDVLAAFETARAAVRLADASTDKAKVLDAISTLSHARTRDAISAIRSAKTDDPDVRAAVARAVTAIEGRLAVINAVQTVWYGLSLGSVLLLAAIGLAITFGVMGVINMAHGEMVMIGAYTTFVVQEVFRSAAPGLFDLSLPIAIPLAFLVTALVGVAIERGIICFLYGRPLETLLATWGVSLILQQGVRTIFGPTNRDVGAPSYMAGSIDVMGVSIGTGRLCIVIFTLVVFAALLLVLKATPLGLQMRAVTQNRRMASAMGIRTPWIDAMTFALGSGIAGIAGVALSQIDNVSPNLGQAYIIDSFMVVVFGGVGSLWGTLVSAFALGIANKVLEPMAGAVLAKILILVLLILFIQKRPRGLFALRGRAVET
jgi:urea transport system permease protein